MAKRRRPAGGRGRVRAVRGQQVGGRLFKSAPSSQTLRGTRTADGVRYYDLDADLAVKPAAPQFDRRPLAGWWRRVGAFAIDAAVLAVFGMLLGRLSCEFLAALGAWGRWIGAAIAWIYLGFMNSGLSGGQTLGKRLLKIRVVGADGKPLPVIRSCVRVAVVLAAFSPLIGSPDMVRRAGFLGLFAGYGVGGAFFCLHLFNRGARQSLHDLAAGSWVVRTVPFEPRSLVRTARSQGIPVAVWCGLVLCVVGFRPGARVDGDSFQPQRIQHAIQRSQPVRRVSVSRGRNLVISPQQRGRRLHQFDVTAVLSVRPRSFDQVADQIAHLAIESSPEIAATDMLNVSLSYGYDILIAWDWDERAFSFPPAEWQRRFGALKPSRGPAS